MSDYPEEIDGYPVNRVVFDAPHTIVKDCVVCGETHWHGYESALERGEYDKSHRVAHCHVESERDPGGYWLVPEGREIGGSA